MEVFSKKAESDLSYNLQAAKTRQRIKEEQMQVKIIERTQEIQVQEQEVCEYFSLLFQHVLSISHVLPIL